MVVAVEEEEEYQRPLAAREEMVVEELRTERQEELLTTLEMLRWGPQWAVLGCPLTRPEDPHKEDHPQQLQKSSPIVPGERDGQCPEQAPQVAGVEELSDPVVSSGHPPALMLTP